MSGWDEDNFLDELTPSLRQDPHPCPDPETLCAVLDGEASESLREAVAAHAARCPECAWLQQRLGAFQRAEESDAEWNQTGKRLDNWLEGWLAGQPADRERRADGWWRSFTGLNRWQWAVVAAGLVVVLSAGLLRIERGHSTRPIGYTAIAPIPIPPAPAQSAPDTKPAEDFERSLTGKIVEAVKSSGGSRPTTRAEAPPPPADSPPAPVETAAAAPLEPPPAASSQPANPLPAGTLRPVRMTPPGVPAPGAASAPARVRLNAGTRLWIFLKSLHGRPDQSFEFRGVVLLPVTEGPAVLLDQETEVYGTGKVNQGRTSVHIQQFGLRGARYQLTGPAATPGEQPAGSGGSLQFDAGQVLEMWLASASTYQKVSGESGQP